MTSVQNYPFLVSVYKGEGRILIIPFIEHKAGYSVHARWYASILDMDDYDKIGTSLIEAVGYIFSSPICEELDDGQEEASWKKNSKYKNWLSFWKNNYSVNFMKKEEGDYVVYSRKRSEKRKGSYGGTIKSIALSSLAKPEEIGRAVIEVFEAAEEYYSDKPAYDPYPIKNISLLDESVLIVKHPADKHFEDAEDGGAAEIYQCYSYVAQEGGESSAEFFLGIAPELDCNMNPSNVRSMWEELHGKAEIFEMQECKHEIFTHRAEMRNKNIHKISYLMQSEEDLLLECSMELHQPGRRKKLDEKLTGLFEEFVRNCKR